MWSRNYLKSPPYQSIPAFPIPIFLNFELAYYKESV